MQQLLQGPFRWVPWRWVVQALADFPMPFEMASLAGMHTAMLRRVSRITLRSTRLEALDLCALCGRDCEPLAHPWRRWRRDGLALILHRGRESVEGDAALASLTSHRAFKRQVREARPPLLAHSLLRTRLGRWAAGDLGAHFPRLRPCRARGSLSR